MISNAYKKRMIALLIVFIIIALTLVFINVMDINNSLPFWISWFVLFILTVIILYQIGIKKRVYTVYYDFDYQKELKLYRMMIKKNNSIISYDTLLSMGLKRKHKGKKNQNEYNTYSRWKKHISDFINKHFFENPNNDVMLEDFIFYLNNKKWVFEDLRFAIGSLIVPTFVLVITLFSNIKSESVNYLIDIVSNTIEINIFTDANYIVISCIITVIVLVIYISYDIGKAGLQNNFLDEVIAICKDMQKKKSKKEIREKLTVDLLVDFISSDEIL